MCLKQFFKLLACLYFFLTSHYAFCQDFTETFSHKQYKITKTGMLTLGSWAVSNIAVNAILIPNATGTPQYFHEMNVYWNLVNLAIAGGGYWANQKKKGKRGTLYEVLSNQHKIEKSLLFNAGLDLAYITAGQLLRERANHVIENRERLKGFGNGLILQGAFLFAFDVVLHAAHVSHRKKNKNQLQDLKLVLNAGGIRMYF